MCQISISGVRGESLFMIQHRIRVFRLLSDWYVQDHTDLCGPYRCPELVAQLAWARTKVALSRGSQAELLIMDARGTGRVVWSSTPLAHAAAA